MTETPDRPILQPGIDHPLELREIDHQVRISVGEEQLAGGAEALELREHTYPPVLYVRRSDIAPRFLQRSMQTSWSPYKGKASYFHIRLKDGSLLENAVWSYESPFAHIAAIKDRLAFYPGKVRVEQLQAASA
ncbi:DUF427 domain-containing protein [Maricaulis sp.]|uniref:DUF427 domain-containing protein n=1 Tax=Maricaulis sp. TaxID=1486257 RepID=UPI003A8D165E